MGAGGAEGAIDASNIIKPFLARGDIKVIGATTIDEYNKFISIDKALDRRFQKINISEANKESVRDIVFGLKDVYEKYHGVVLKKRVLETLINYSFDCIFTGRQPDKTIDLLDEVCAFATLNSFLNNELLDYEVSIKKVELDKNNEIRKHNFKKALIYRNRELELRNEYNNKLFNNTNKTIITKEIIEKVIYNRYGILSNEEYNNRFNDMNIDKEIVEILNKYDYIKNNKPISILLVSKNVLDSTLMVDKIAKNIYECNYIVIDMNDYKEYPSIYKQFESINNNPFSIVFLKNIDKGNRRIMKVIYDSIGNGYIDKINISKCIFFMSVSSVGSCIGFDEKIICKEGYDNFTKIVNYN